MKTIKNWFKENPDWRSKIFIEDYFKSLNCYVKWDSNQYSEFDGYLTYNNSIRPIELKCRDCYSWTYNTTLINLEKYQKLVASKGILIVIFKDCFYIFKNVAAAFDSCSSIYCRSTTHFNGKYGLYDKVYLSLNKGKCVSVDTSFCYTGEVWKAIPGYTDYECSTNGRIRNIKTGKIRIPYKDTYLKLNINKKCCYVHRLVAITFLGNYTNLQVNHINENKYDNRIDNLEWCDSEYNNNFGTKNNRCSIANSIKIIKCDLNGNEICSYKSTREAEKLTGIANQNIAKVLKNKRKSAGGFYWKYA